MRDYLFPLTVVVPVFNERPTIETVIRLVADVPVKKEIIIVDDGSSDGTREWLEEFAARPFIDDVRVLIQDRNRGKGAAVRRGFQEARGAIVIIQDADLELAPREYPNLMRPIETGEADVVYGSRMLDPNQFRGARANYIANVILTGLSNALTGYHLTDVWTGFKAVRGDIAHRVVLREDRFGLEPEITEQFSRLGCRVSEVPVAYRPRSYSAGKKIRFRDAIDGVWCTFKCHFRR